MRMSRPVVRIFFLILVFFASIFPAKAAEPDFLAPLKAQVATVQTIRSEFTQETVIPMFAKPMLTQGRFVFKRPDALVWEYTSPIREGFSLRAGKGFRWDDGRESRVAFTAGDDPVATVIARQLVAWITFDTDSLSSEYVIEKAGDTPLILKMVPRKDDVRSVIAAIAVTFSPEGPARLVEVFEVRGGKTSIAFTGTIVNAPIADEEFE